MKDPGVPIRLLVTDIDGCVTPGEGHPLSFEVLQTLTMYNRQAQERVPHIPAITLCTGRPAPYVELMVQAIGGFLPALYEHGAGMYNPQDYTYQTHPKLSLTFQRQYDHCKAVLEEQIVRQGLGYFQPGKEWSFTLYPRSSVSPEELLNRISGLFLLEEYGFAVQRGIREINILPGQIDKGIGVEWLAEQLQYLLTEIAGVGDTNGDLAFLQRVGFATAPNNAVETVKAHVAYVSPFPDGRGVLDILERCIQWNKQVSAE